MIVRNYFSHQIPPDGHTVFDVMSNDGYCFKLAGENIGWNNYPDDQATTEIQTMFMNSPGSSPEHPGPGLGRGRDRRLQGRRRQEDVVRRVCRQVRLGSAPPPKPGQVQAEADRPSRPAKPKVHRPPARRQVRHRAPRPARASARAPAPSPERQPTGPSPSPSGEVAIAGGGLAPGHRSACPAGPLRVDRSGRGRPVLRQLTAPPWPSISPSLKRAT